MSDDNKLQCRISDTWNMYSIYYPGGGVIPKKLEGKFTSEAKAREAIDAFYRAQGIKTEREALKKEVKSIEDLDFEEFDDDLLSDDLQ